ncbi:MAG TPA: ATP-dependent DNA helicase UvrD2, partial [Marmoricola sp.]|nr:ATP-dependent DNA helicase UvrD2 [Marmoricola sp.]
MSLPPPATRDLLSSLDPEQRAVAEALRGPVRVLAGAGTGKTRAITHRIAHGVQTGIYQPDQVLAVTFTTRAAGEMRGRLRQLGAGSVQARTFHSAALRQVRWFWPKVYGSEPPTLTESKIPLLAAASRRVQVNADQATLRDLASEIEWAKVSNIDPANYFREATSRGREVSMLDLSSVAEVYEGYEELKRSQGRMDMEDVLLCAAALVADDARVAAQVRQQYRWFVVDEFQDVSPLQHLLLDLWLGGRDELCVVGDPSQTIYSFAGASSNYLLNFKKWFPQATTVELVRNYRSTPEVIRVANEVIGPQAANSVTLQAQRPSGAAVEWLEAPDEPAEAAAVAARIKILNQRGLALSDMAVLFRINAQSEAFEDALADAGIPYVVRGAARFFERPEVRQALSLLRVEARAEETGALSDHVRAVVMGMGWNVTAPTSRGKVRDRWESLSALVSQADAFAAAEATATLAGFVAEMDRRANEQHAPQAEGVTLATMHTAKGLEWEAVFCAGIQEGSLPITYADTPAAVEEERRLLYVAVTRARTHLQVSWALARNAGGQSRRRPSRFLDGLRPVSITDKPQGDRVSGRRAGRRVAVCRICRTPLATAAERNRGYCADCPIPYDLDLFEALKAWRRQRSEADQVPAYVVFSDATLEEIAEKRPANLDMLVGVRGVGPGKRERYG